MITKVVILRLAAERIELYEDPPFIYLCELYNTEAINARVEDYRPRFAENFYLHEVSVSDGE